MCERGEWEAEQGKGRGIVVCSNGGFPPPVSQKCHVTRPDKEWDPELRGRLERAEAEGGARLHRLASQSITLCLLFCDVSHCSATDQIDVWELSNLIAFWYRLKLLFMRR